MLGAMSLFVVAQVLAVAFSLAVVVVETRVLVRREKYWPLAADDYAVAALMTVAVVLGSPVGLAVGWSLALGSLYATLFSRLDPAYRGTKKWRLLVVAMVVCGAGLAATLGSI
jgi:hypothetical protein